MRRANGVGSVASTSCAIAECSPPFYRRGRLVHVQPRIAYLAADLGKLAHQRAKPLVLRELGPRSFDGIGGDGAASGLALIENVLRSRRHPQQAFRSCLGILRLAESHGEDRLEAAAGKAVALGANSYRSVESILNHRLDQRPCNCRGSHQSGDLRCRHGNHLLSSR